MIFLLKKAADLALVVVKACSNFVKLLLSEVWEY